MTILITGAQGYVGSILTRELAEMGEDIIALDTNWYGQYPVGDLEKRVHRWNHELSPDPEDNNEFSELLVESTVSSVVHLSGLSNDPTADFAPHLNNYHNIGATKTLAHETASYAAMASWPVKFIYASTCSVYYTPPNDEANVRVMTEEMPVAPTANYSKSKRLGEVELMRLAGDYRGFYPVILRKGTLFGESPRMRFDLVVNTMVLHAWLSGVITVNGGGEVWRPLLHVRDAVDAYIHMIYTDDYDKIGCRVFNLVHKNYRVLELAHWVSEILGQEHDADIRVVRNRAISDGGRSYYVSSDKITEELGFQPARGIREAVVKIWNNLSAGEYGYEPLTDSKYFNILHMKKMLDKESIEESAR